MAHARASIKACFGVRCSAGCRRAGAGRVGHCNAYECCAAAAGCGAPTGRCACIGIGHHAFTLYAVSQDGYAEVIIYLIYKLLF